MGMADSDRDGGSGNTGGRGGGSSGGSTSSGGGRSGGFNGRDTPGAPSAPDGKRGSTMGKDGGVARGNDGNQGGPGVDTPGSPSNPGRRGTVAGATISARESARRARESLSRPASLTGESNLGIGEAYSHADAIAERAKTGMVHPREMEMARGYYAGKQSSLASQAMGGLIGQAASAATGLPGAATMANAGLAGLTDTAPKNPEGRYGRTVGINQTGNTTVQDAAEAAAGVTMGPAGSIAAGMVNAAINDNRTRDITRMGQALGIAADNPGVDMTAGAGGAGSRVSASTTNARTSMQPRQVSPEAYSAPVIDRNQYSRGLLSLAQKIR